MICIDARYVRERPSGIGAMVAEIVRRVPGLLPSRRFLLLKHPKAPSRLVDADNVREVVVAAEANGPATLLALPWVADLREVRLFHATFNILPAGLGCATVTTVHDLMWLDTPELCRSPGPWGRVEQAFYGNGIRRALSRSTRLIAVSDATRAAIARRDERAGERTVVIRHGIDPAFRPASGEAEQRAIDGARRRHAPGAERHVLTVGQAAGYKNQRAAVRAFARAFGGDGGTHLLLVQRLGAEAGQMLSLAEQLGVGRRVHVLPAVAFDELLALYRGALCLLHPSLVEGWGMPITEAMACGCPVVTSDRSSMPEVTGGAALLVDPTDDEAIAGALRRIAGDERLAGELRARGLERAAQLGWDDHARQTARLYEELLG